MLLSLYVVPQPSFVVQVKATLKSERAKVPRRRFSSRQRTSRFMGVGSSNRKNQWQARILVHGKVCSPLVL